MNADGTNVRQLTNNTHLDWASSWSPDGTQIAFTSERCSGWQVFVMNADGTNQRQLTDRMAPTTAIRVGRQTEPGSLSKAIKATLAILKFTP